MRNMRCLGCNWVGSKEKLIKDGRCPRCKSDNIIISLSKEEKRK